jgi:hypothetical protein
MRKFTVSAVTAGALAAAALGFAGASAAVPLAGTAADTAISSLQADGFSVRINGQTSNVPLSRCTVTDITGLRNSNVDASGQIIDRNQAVTVFVTVSCPKIH